MSHEVFISYSSLDKDTADMLCAALEESGTACWIAPRDVMPGKPYGEALIDAINDSHIMVLVLSEHSNHSQQVVREVERAASKGIPIIPLRIADVRLAKSLEYFLSSCHWLDAIGGHLESHLPRLTEAVNEMLRQCYDGETLRLGPSACAGEAARRAQCGAADEELADRRGSWDHLRSRIDFDARGGATFPAAATGNGTPRLQPTATIRRPVAWDAASNGPAAEQ